MSPRDAPEFSDHCRICGKSDFRDALHYLNHVPYIHEDEDPYRLQSEVLRTLLHYDEDVEDPDDTLARLTSEIDEGLKLRCPQCEDSTPRMLGPLVQHGRRNHTTREFDELVAWIIGMVERESPERESDRSPDVAVPNEDGREGDSGDNRGTVEPHGDASPVSARSSSKPTETSRSDWQPVDPPDVWTLAYHLGGPTFLDVQKEQLFGTLPIPMESAVLQVLDRTVPDLLDLETRDHELTFHPERIGEDYTWVQRWRFHDETVGKHLQTGAGTAVLNQMEGLSSELVSILKSFFNDLPRKFPVLQTFSLYVLRELMESGQDEIHVVEHAPTYPGLTLAMLDVLVLVDQVAELYDLPVDLPDLRVSIVEPEHEELVESILGLYLQHGGLEDRRLNPVSIDVGLKLTDAVPSDADVIITHASPREDPPEHAFLFKDIRTRNEEFREDIGTVPDRIPLLDDVDRDVLDYFGRRYFPIGELRPEQVSLLQMVLRGEPALGLLPTGYGKSLVYQLHSLLIPGTTLVISPLISLMRDQVHSLRKLGMSAVESISSKDPKGQKEETLERFSQRKLRLLYIAPERLQERGFQERLFQGIDTSPIRLFTVDEAHCVSEWGHDFRPSYLQIQPVQDRIEQAVDRPVPILALTATASEPVREDILRLLRLPPDSVRQMRSSDRPELSISVHMVEEGLGKRKEVEHLLTEEIPRSLDIPADELLGHSVDDPPYPHGGVVFGIYASATGKNTIREGVANIAGHIQDTVAQDPHLLRVHSSTPPPTCEKCDSTTLDMPLEQGDSTIVCQDCGHEMERSDTDRPDHWDEDILKHQDDFQDSRYPLMVATKGFGMGIDKQNLRWIVHHAFASGLEAYYQEAGRAGRDGDQAHVALLYAPPTQECLEEHVYGDDLEPPCAGDQFWRCPYGLEQLCDYGRQARFIHDSFEGVDSDLEKTLEVFGKLESGQEQIRVNTRGWSGDDRRKQTELALYRLQLLGIVDRYSIDYHGRRSQTFHIDYNADWKGDEAIENLVEYLEHMELAPSVAREKAQPLQGRLTKTGKVRKGQRKNFIETAVRAMLERVYETIPRMRYETLRNELDYATADDDDLCRRIILRSIFDDQEVLPSSDYECGFCDSCRPDLEFDRDEARVPEADKRVTDLVKELPDLIDSFDIPKLEDFVDRIMEANAGHAAYAQAAHRLETEPNNLAALLLTGMLGVRVGGSQREMSAREHLTYGFEEAQRQDRSRDEIRRFYDEAKQLDADKAFQLLTRADGPFDDPDGHRLAYREACDLFGDDSSQARSMLLRLKTDRIDEFDPGHDPDTLRDRIADARKKLATIGRSTPSEEE